MTREISTHGIIRRLSVMTFVFMAASCAPAVRSLPGAPVADPAEVAGRVTRATAPDAPRQVTFAWTLDEAGSTIRGRGVVRFQPERIRLDLFGPRGETYLIAALVEGEFRIPPAAGRFELPSPALLWAALGVVQPPRGATLTAVTEDGASALLEYSGPADIRHRFTISSAAADPRPHRVDRIGGSGVLETVEMEYAQSAVPRRARYVDRRNFRELILEVEEVREADAFPDEIWSPDAAAGV